MKEIIKLIWEVRYSLLFSVIILFFMAFIIIILFVPVLNPFVQSGEITGEFIEGYHEGYGDFCGDYPNSGIRLCNASYNKDHFYRGNWFYFGNQYSGIDKMIVGQEYTIWYHQESRPANTTDSEAIKYFVIDNVKGDKE